jgi:hypothetical protein
MSLYKGPRAQEHWFDKPEPQHIEVPQRVALRSAPQVNKKRLRLAEHEAAHAVTASVFGIDIKRVWIRGNRGECEVDEQQYKVKYLDSVTMLLSGEANDSIFWNRKHDENSHDRLNARSFASLRETKINGKLSDGEQTMVQCWDQAQQLVREHRQSIRVLGKMLYDRGELDADDVAAVIRLCAPREETSNVRKRPYEGHFRSARSGAPEFTDPDDPLTQKLYGRAVAFWSQINAR